MRRFDLGVGGLGNLVLDRFVWGWCDCGDVGYGWLLCCFGFFWSVTIIAGEQCRVLVVYWFWVYLVGVGFCIGFDYCLRFCVDCSTSRLWVLVVL